jgi:hypothetical protein
VLSEAERSHLEGALYPRALEKAGEPDSPRNRSIAANDYWMFLQLGGGSDADAIEALVRGLRACDIRG